jgi:hypothetical protein
MTTRLRPLTRVTLQEAPIVCHSCVWWQSKTGRRTNKDRWIDSIEDDFGAWGSLYHDDDGRVVGSMQFGPAELFPRAYELPAGPPSDDAMLIACAYLADRTSPWILQSLFLAAIGEAKDRGAKSLETFGYRYAEGESQYERFQVHKTIFPRDFLSDFGFQTVRSAGPVELVRLDLGGLVPVTEGRRARVLRLVRQAFQPAPVPQRP